MTRKQLVEKCFQHLSSLTWSNDRYRVHVSALSDWMKEADQVDNDQTVALFSLQQDIAATIVSKQDGIVAGTEEVVGLWEGKHGISMTADHADGEPMRPKDVILTLRGPAYALLSSERLILSILGRMSGIATLTDQLHSSIREIPDHPFIAATRKTPWMLLDKKAVAVGGGLTHRLDLSGVLIKDNHLAAAKQTEGFTTTEDSIRSAVKRALSSGQTFFEIEVNNQAQLRVAVASFTKERTDAAAQTMIIMLDNMMPASATECIKELRSHPLYASILVEVSGEITRETIRPWATIGADVLSVGQLTHSAPVANLSLDII